MSVAPIEKIMGTEIKEIAPVKEIDFPRPPVGLQASSPKFKSEDIENIVKAMNKLTDYANRTQKFEIHKGTGRIVVKIIDKKSGDVIKEYPSEKFLNLIAKMHDFIGMLFDRKS